MSFIVKKENIMSLAEVGIAAIFRVADCLLDVLGIVFNFVLICYCVLFTRKIGIDLITLNNILSRLCVNRPV